MNSKSKINYRIKLLGLLVVLLVLIMGTSFAYFKLTQSGKNTNVIKSGSLKLLLDESTTDGISITKAIPVTNTTGLKEKGYTFKLVNQDRKGVKYKIYLDDMDLENGKTRMPDRVVKYNLTKNDTQGESKLLTTTGENPNRILESGTIDGKSTNDYTLKLWIDEAAETDIMNTVFAAKLRVVAEVDKDAPIKSDMTVDLDDENKKLDLDGKNPNDFDFSSSDEDIATIDKDGNIVTPGGHGEVTITVTDKETGVKKEYTLTITKTLKATFIKQTGISKIEKDSTTCKLTTKGIDSCSIKLPSQTAEKGYTALGWSLDKDATSGIKSNIEIDKDIKMYSVAKKNIIDIDSDDKKIDLDGKDPGNLDFSSSDNSIGKVDENGNFVPSGGHGDVTITITDKTTGKTEEVTYNITKTLKATFIKQTGISEIEKESATCKLTTKGVNTCSVKLPNQTAEKGYTALGWSKEKNATSGVKSTIEISEDTKIYSVAKKNIIDVDSEDKKIDLGGKNPENFEFSSSDNSIGKVDKDGNFIPGGGHGDVTITITDKTTGEKEDITYNITKTLKATYVTQNGVLSISKDSDTCKLTTKGIDTCSVELPTIVTNSDYQALGWNKDKTSHVGITKSISISEDTNIYTITKKNEIVLTASFKKGLVGINSIGSNSLSCTIDSVYNNEEQATTCNIVLPEINTLDSYTVVGWSEVENDTKATAIGTTIAIDSNKTFYTVIKKDEITLTATFNKNGAISLDGSTESEIKKSCLIESVYNNEEQKTSCTITSPTIEASEATPIVIGYNEDIDSTIATVKANSLLELTTDKKYYALTKSSLKTITVTFNKNGAKSLSSKTDDTVNESCIIPITYNGVSQNKACNITSPSIEGSEATPNVIGFSVAIDNHSSSWNVNSIKAVSEDNTYYAQTYQNEKTITADFKIASSDKIASIQNSEGKSITSTADKVSESCKIAKTYNGVVQSTSCEITTPIITVKDGYHGPYFATSKDATSGTNPNSKLIITGNPTYYANASISSFNVIYDYETNGGSSTATNEKFAYGESIDLSKTATKEGYTFKGWNTSKDATEGLKELKMGTKDVRLYAIFKDETKPKCSFSTSDAIGLNSNAILTLTCSDAGSGINPKDLSSSITVSSNGKLVSVSEPSVVVANKKYSYIVTIQGIKAGTFTASLKAGAISDVAGNSNDAVTSSNIAVKKGNITPSVNMTGYTYGGVKSEPTVSGNLENGAVAYYYNTTNSNNGGTSWSTVASSTSLNAGTYYMYAIVGATENYNEVTTEPVKFVIGKAAGSLELSTTSGQITYGTASTSFTVTKNISSGSLTVTDNNATATSNISGTTVTLTNLGTINAGTNINVTVTSAETTNYKAATASYTLSIIKANINPTISMSGYTFAGTKQTPSVSGNSGNGTVTYYYNTTNSNSGGTSWNTVTSSSSLAVGTYYMYATIASTTNYNGATTKPVSFTISGIKRTVTFVPNGNTISTPSGCSLSGNNVICSCKTTGTSLACNITSPTITAPTATPSVIGFSTGSTTYTNSYSSNTAKSISSNSTYYAQSTAQEKTYSATLTKGSNVSSIGKTILSCTINATYNGKTQATSCTTSDVLPSITPNSGYVTVGWTKKDTTTPVYAVGTSLTLTTASSEYISNVRAAMASEVSYSNSEVKDESGNVCSNVQCALDSISRTLK